MKKLQALTLFAILICLGLAQDALTTDTVDDATLIPIDTTSDIQAGDADTGDQDIPNTDTIDQTTVDPIVDNDVGITDNAGNTTISPNSTEVSNNDQDVNTTSTDTSQNSTSLDNNASIPIDGSNITNATDQNVTTNLNTTTNTTLNSTKPNNLITKVLQMKDWVKGTIIGVVLGFISLCVCLLMFNQNIRKACRTALRCECCESEDQVQDISIKTIEERQIEEVQNREKHFNTITVRTKKRLNQMLGKQVFEIADGPSTIGANNGTIPTRPEKPVEQDEENGVEDDSNSSQNEGGKYYKSSENGQTDYKKTRRESQAQFNDSENDGSSSIDNLNNDLKRFDTQIHRLDTHHDILEENQHVADSEEEDSSPLSSPNKKDSKEQDMEDNEAEEIVINRPNKLIDQEKK